MSFYAYVPHNPTTNIDTDDLVAFPYGKRTLYKAAGLLLYFAYNEESDYEYYVKHGCTLQGVWRPVQPVNKAAILRNMGQANLNARDTVWRPHILLGEHDHLRLFPPFYGRPEGGMNSIEIEYLCRQCKEPLPCTEHTKED